MLFLSLNFPLLKQSRGETWWNFLHPEVERGKFAPVGIDISFDWCFFFFFFDRFHLIRSKLYGNFQKKKRQIISRRRKVSFAFKIFGIRVWLFEYMISIRSWNMFSRIIVWNNISTNYSISCLITMLLK